MGANNDRLDWKVIVQAFEKLYERSNPTIRPMSEMHCLILPVITVLSDIYAITQSHDPILILFFKSDILYKGHGAQIWISKVLRSFVSENFRQFSDGVGKYLLKDCLK